MIEKNRLLKKNLFFGLVFIGSILCLLNPSKTNTIEAAKSVATHIGTFEGSTTFTTSSSNGINPGLFIEVMDDEGNLTQYESEEGVITIPNTQEGAYVTQAKLLGKTKYVDQDTSELLDQFKEGRNLRLASVENPTLKMTGKNLFNPLTLVHGANGYYNGSLSYTPNYSNKTRALLLKDELIKVTPNSTVTLSCPIGFQCVIQEYDKNENRTKMNDMGWQTIGRQTLTVGENTELINLYFTKQDPNSTTDITSEELEMLRNSIQLEIGTDPTSYVPYQFNTITVNEDIILRGVPQVRDELDLITGDVTKNIGDMVLDGSREWIIFSTVNGNNRFRYSPLPEVKDNSTALCMTDKLPTYLRTVVDHSYAETIGVEINNREVWIYTDHTKRMPSEEFKTYLSQNPIALQYELESPNIKTVALNSDYFFKPIHNESIEVTGTINPLVVSVTVPTDSLSFTLDPNQETGRQFIAPDFILINETLAPLQVELKTFEQTSDVLNDVLPEAHENWNELNKTESQDIALALVSTPSDGWLSLNKGLRYVVNASNDFIGTVKGKSSVGFSFNALHGQSFSEVLNPQYRLTFVFGFNQ